LAASAWRAVGRRDGPPDSGVRGRPKRAWLRRANPVTLGAMRRAGAWPRIGADRPLVVVGNTVWRIKRWPVWNTWAAAGAALSVAEGQIAPKRLPWLEHQPRGGMVSGYAVSDLVPGRSRQEAPGSGATWLMTGSPFSRAGRAGFGGGSERRRNLRKSRGSRPRSFRRCTGRLNATQPAVRNSLQHLVHTRNGRGVQGKRRGTATIARL